MRVMKSEHEPLLLSPGSFTLRVDLVAVGEGQENGLEILNDGVLLQLLLEERDGDDVVVEDVLVDGSANDKVADPLFFHTDVDELIEAVAPVVAVVRVWAWGWCSGERGVRSGKIDISLRGVRISPHALKGSFKD